MFSLKLKEQFADQISLDVFLSSMEKITLRELGNGMHDLNRIINAMPQYKQELAVIAELKQTLEIVLQQQAALNNKQKECVPSSNSIIQKLMRMEAESLEARKNLIQATIENDRYYRGIEQIILPLNEKWKNEKIRRAGQH
jgi:hypothetical protein